MQSRVRAESAIESDDSFCLFQFFRSAATDAINNVRIFRAPTRQIGAQSMVAWSRLIKTRPCTNGPRRSLFPLIRYQGRCTVTSFIAPTKVPFNRRYSIRTPRFDADASTYPRSREFVLLIVPYYCVGFLFDVRPSRSFCERLRERPRRKIKRIAS